MGATKVNLGVVRNYNELFKHRKHVDTRILNVCALWEICPSTKDNEVDPRFYKALERMGWRDSSHGINKMVFVNKDLVLKLAHLQTDDEYESSGIDSEWRIWRRAKGKKKLHLAECVLYYNWRLLFQKKVPRVCRNWQVRLRRLKDGTLKRYIKECDPARKLAIQYRILDWAHNHGHMKNKRTVFYDYDNHGSGWEAWKLRRGNGSSN